MWNGTLLMISFAGLGDGAGAGVGAAVGVGDSAGVGAVLGVVAGVGDRLTSGEFVACWFGWVHADKAKTTPATIATRTTALICMT